MLERLYDRVQADEPAQPGRCRRRHPGSRRCRARSSRRRPMQRLVLRGDRHAQAARARPQRRAARLSRPAEEHELVFAEGPAGTGKTWLAVGHAVQLLEHGAGGAAGPVAPRGGGGRAARLPARRHEGEGRSLSAAHLRRALRFHGGAQRRTRAADRHDRDRAARLHARAHADQRHRPARRSAEHHRDADEDVPHPPGRGHRA